MSEAWDTVNVAASRDGEAMSVRQTPVVELADELRELLATKG